MLRVTRLGPLVPARLQWLDHEPGAPDNKLDRGRLSVFPCVDIAGAEVPPEEITERLYRGPGHWKFCEPVSEAEYRYQLSHLEWAKAHRPEDPTLRPRRAVDPAQVPLPNFDRENSLL
jgi:hypothetical protein